MEEHYSTFMWKDIQMYLCAACPHDFDSEEGVEEHYQHAHIVPLPSSPIIVTQPRRQRTRPFSQDAQEGGE